MNLASFKRLALAGLLVFVTASAGAQGYPTRPVRIVVPYAPGGASDLVARIISERMGALLGQPMVVENKVGGGGTVGAMDVVRARPDGYSLSLATASTVATLPAINPQVAYDPAADFTPLVNIAATPMVLAVNKDFPARIEKTGAVIVGNTPEQFARQVRLEYELYKRVVARQKLTLD